MKKLLLILLVVFLCYVAGRIVLGPDYLNVIGGY